MSEQLHREAPTEPAQAGSVQRHVRRTGPDEKHPNWEPDEGDEAYTTMRRGCFTGGWEQFARFLYVANKELNDRLTEYAMDNPTICYQCGSAVPPNVEAEL